MKTNKLTAILALALSASAFAGDHDPGAQGDSWDQESRRAAYQQALRYDRTNRYNQQMRQQYHTGHQLSAIASQNAAGRSLRPTMRYYGKGYSIAYNYVPTDRFTIRSAQSFKGERFEQPIENTQILVAENARVSERSTNRFRLSNLSRTARTSERYYAPISAPAVIPVRATLPAVAEPPQAK